MLNLREDVEEMFALLEGCAGRLDQNDPDQREPDFYRTSLDYRRSFVDPHKAADAFIAADETTRERIREAAKAGKPLPLPTKMKHPHQHPDSLRARARRLRAQGLAVREVAKRCGTTHGWVLSVTKAA